jgi:hypothetical protein
MIAKIKTHDNKCTTSFVDTGPGRICTMTGVLYCGLKSERPLAVQLNETPTLTLSAVRQGSRSLVTVRGHARRQLVVSALHRGMRLRNYKRSSMGFVHYE